jgi:protein-S-isoprenylcysteine O-methyltransferase Ste14
MQPGELDRWGGPGLKFMKKLLPTSLLLISLVVMIFLWWLFPIAQFITFPARLLGLLPLLAGLGISVLGSNKFEEVGTNVKTFDNPDVLITDGLYRFSRNPMYLGFVIALLGVFMLLGSLSTLVVVLGFFVITDRWYIQFEERAMDRVFGEAFHKYKKQTRRWL